jgi:hypothetical protein
VSDRAGHHHASVTWTRREFLAALPPLAAASRTLGLLAAGEPTRVCVTGRDDVAASHRAWFNAEGRCRVIDDPREADALVIGSQETSEDVVEACRSGKHVYCEASPTTEAWMLASRLAKSRGVALQTPEIEAFTRLHHVATMVREGRLGRVLRTCVGHSPETWSANFSMGLAALERSLRRASTSLVASTAGPSGLTVITERGMLMVDRERLCCDPSHLLEPAAKTPDARADWLESIRQRRTPLSHFGGLIA